MQAQGNRCRKKHTAWEKQCTVISAQLLHRAVPVSLFIIKIGAER